MTKEGAHLIVCRSLSAQIYTTGLRPWHKMFSPGPLLLWCHFRKYSTYQENEMKMCELHHTFQLLLGPGKTVSMNAWP